MPTAEEVSSNGQAEYKDGVLTVRGGGFGSPGVNAKNAVIRVLVKKLEGGSLGNVSLGLRMREQGWYGAYYGGGAFGVNKWVKSGGAAPSATSLQIKPSPKAFDDYFEFSFKVEGDLLTVEADGEEVIRVHDSTHSDVGGAWWMPFNCTALFKKAEIKILDGSTQTSSVRETAPNRAVVPQSAAAPEQSLERDPKPAMPGEFHQFAGHTDTVWGVAFSNDGRQLWTGSSDRTVRIWDQDTGATVRQIELRGGRIVRVACADDFRTILTSHPRDRFVRVWNTESGQELRQLQGHASPVWSISLSPDGRRALAGAEDGAVRLWDVNTGNEIGRLDGHTGLVQSVVFSPDGRRAVSGGGGADARGQPADSSVRVWDLERGQELQCLRGHTNGVTGVAFTPDARHVVSASYDKTVRVWDVQTGTELHRFEGHAEVLECVAVAPDGRVAVSGGHDKVVRLWRLPVDSVAKAVPASAPPRLVRLESAFRLELERQAFRWAARRIRGEFTEPTWIAFWETMVAGQPCADVAARLGRSVGAIYTARSRVMQRLKEELEHFDWNSEPDEPADGR